MIATSKALQEKIEAMEKRAYYENENNNHKIYCWIHSRTRNNNHTSSVYNNKKTGHQDDATLTTINIFRFLMFLYILYSFSPFLISFVCIVIVSFFLY